MAKRATRKSMRLGGGGRFKKLTSRFGRAKGRTSTGRSRRIKNPGGLAAAIGRKKYGKARFQKLAAAGRRRAAARRR